MSAIFWGRNSTARPRSIQKRPFRPSRIFPTSTRKTLRPCPEGPATFPTHIQLGIRNALANAAQKRPARWTRFEFRCARVTSLLPPCPIYAITNSFFWRKWRVRFFLGIWLEETLAIENGGGFWIWGTERSVDF